MVLSGFSTSLNNLKDISKVSSAKHKELIEILHGLDINTCDTHTNKTLIELSTLEKFAHICSSLIDLDLNHSQQIQNFQDGIKSFMRMKRASKTIKSQLISLEKYILKEKSNIDEIVTKIKSALSNPIRDLNSILPNQKIEKIVKKLVPVDIINNFDRLYNYNVPIKLLHSLTGNNYSEEPEIETSSYTDNKKLINHNNLLIKTLETVARELLEALKDTQNKNLKDENNIEESKLSNAISTNELKVLKLKINRLHTRGSLTDEEARNMLGKITFLPDSTIYSDAELQNCIKDVNNTFINGENPITETREKQELLSKNSKNKVKNIRAIKRSSTATKKITRNTSLPKAISISKHKYKEHIKSSKIKNKSPHSFM